MIYIAVVSDIFVASEWHRGPPSPNLNASHDKDNDNKEQSLFVSSVPFSFRIYAYNSNK